MIELLIICKSKSERSANLEFLKNQDEILDIYKSTSQIR
jgi:hypothetical protein